MKIKLCDIELKADKPQTIQYPHTKFVNWTFALNETTQSVQDIYTNVESYYLLSFCRVSRYKIFEHTSRHFCFVYVNTSKHYTDTLCRLTATALC